jgi:hypothetical protein
MTFLGYLLMYVEVRYAVRNNNINTVNQAWANLWPLFHSTQKTKYTFLSTFVTFTLKHTHQSVLDVLQNRLVSLRGFNNRHIGPDYLTEKINLMGRLVIQHIHK